MHHRRQGVALPGRLPAAAGRQCLQYWLTRSTSQRFRLAYLTLTLSAVLPKPRLLYQMLLVQNISVMTDNVDDAQDFEQDHRKVLTVHGRPLREVTSRTIENDPRGTLPDPFKKIPLSRGDAHESDVQSANIEVIITKDAKVIFGRTFVRPAA
jgi:hypothetical protein